MRAFRLIACSFLLLASSLFGADAANDLLITQRNSGNTGNVQRNITATTNTILGWNGTTLTDITAGTGITISGGVISSTAAGTGTVTSVSVTTANGVSGTVATATTTPAITLILGAITPLSVNGNTITTGTGTLTLGSVTLNAGVGGTLGTAAFTAATAYEVPLTFSTGLTRTTNTITANAVNLAASGSGGVTGRLLFANLTQGSGMSLLGVTGSSTADVASIIASSDGQVMRRSGSNIGFGTVDLTSANAVAGSLAIGNGGTGGTTQGTARTGLGLGTIATQDASSVTVGLLTRSGTSSNNTVLGVLSDSTTYNSLTFNNVSSAAGSLGLSGGGGSDTSLYLRIPTGGTFDFRVNNANVTTLSATTLTAKVYASTSNANIVTSKTNFHLTEVNVKDYGATGDGTTDDTTAISNAFAAAQAGASGVGSQVSEIVVVYGGSGYSSTPAVVVSVGSGITATAVVRDQKVIGVSVTAVGTGYTTASVVTFSGGGGSGASAYAIVGNGAVVTFPPGTYYAPSGVAVGGLDNVTINAYGASILRDATSAQPGFWLQGSCRRVTVNGLSLNGQAIDRNGSYGVGILGQGDAITLNECNVSKWPNFAIQFYADTGTESRYFGGPTVKSCKINNTYADGIHLGHGYIGVHFNNNTILTTEEDDAIGIYNDFKSNFATRDVDVSGNIIRDSRWRGILVAGVIGASVTNNVIDGTAGHGVSGDDGSTSGSLTLSLTNSSATATVTSGTAFTGAYIYGTGMSLPTIITAVSGSTVTLSQVANSTSSQTYSMYQGSMNVNITGNTIMNIGTLSKNGSSYTDRMGINFVHCAKQAAIGNFFFGLPSAGYSLSIAELTDITLSGNGGYDQGSGYNTLTVGSNTFGVRATYDDSGYLKYRGTSGTVTTIANP